MKNLTAEKERAKKIERKPPGAVREGGEVRIAPLRNGLSAAATTPNSPGNTSFDFSCS